MIFGIIFNFHISEKIYPQDIKSKIETVLDQVPKNTNYAILIINPLTNDTIFQHNAFKPLIPASNTKLFTTAAAINYLGADYLISTKFYTDDPDLSDGIINGNLYLRGYGDGLFTDQDLDVMISKLLDYNISRITGDVVGDDSFFDQVYSRADWIEGEFANVRVPPVSAIVINKNQAVERRRIRRNRFRNVFVNVKNPPLHAANLLYTKLKNRDVIIDGEATVGVASGIKIELVSNDVKLTEFLSLINKRSDNFLSECLFKIIGANYSGEEGSAFNSAQAINKFLFDNGIENRGTKVVDGSGISRSNQVSVGAIVSLLEFMYLDTKNFEVFHNSLSIAGGDGTLGGRMIGSDAQHNFHGKTGTLNGASSVAGYLTSANKDDYIVAIIFEFSRKGQTFYRRIQDQIIKILAEH